MYYIKETDVVIIGAGAAGAMAAIYAHRANPKIHLTVLDKSKMETSGAAGRGMDALNTMALPPYSYPEDVIDAVQDCILSHRGSIEVERKTIEAKCVASSDGLAHFHQIPALFSVAFLQGGLNSQEAGEWVKEKLERSWQKMLPVHRKILRKKRKAVIDLLGEALAW